MLRALAITMSFLLPTACAQTNAHQRPELGTVTWLTDYDQALTQARQTQRPVFLLFQEIPGCATCTGFGRDVLSQPLLQAAIDAAFVPVVMRNNVDGKEGQVRERFREPAWNNPVVRFVDADGKDLLPRQDGIYSPHGMAQRMVAALEKTKQPVPGYLRIALAETDPKTERAVFQMHCFWEGEALLGAVDGVVATSAAFRDGAEVVAVTFLPDVVAKAKLTEIAQAKSCRPVGTDRVTPAPKSDQQHALGNTAYAKLELTPMQRTKVHAALTLGQDPKPWLTPRQLAALAAR